MTEKQDEKSKLPLTGLIAVVAMITGYLYYEGITLKTVRPIDKEKATSMLQRKSLVQSRLWQDPFEAIEAHRQLEQKRSTQPEEKNDVHTLDRLVEVLIESDVSRLRVLPVFVDGNPYVNGGESRLRDRYAVVSALGAAGYVPESGEYLRFFKWNRFRNNDNYKKEKPEPEAGIGEMGMLVPAELFLPKAKLHGQPHGKPVLILWLKEQDSSPRPLTFLNDLLASLDKTFDKHQSKIDRTYEVLGPRSSAALSAMLKELQPRPGAAPPALDYLKEVRFFSPWATAEDTFLLDQPPALPSVALEGQQTSEPVQSVRELLAKAQIRLTRTIDTDAALAGQLLQELKRRQVDLKSCAAKNCNPKVALISEWDTLYGRSLPRTFAAVAMNNGSGATSASLKSEIDKLRRDEWPGWVYRHSYLAGLDGELPATVNDKDDDKKDDSQARIRAWYEGQLPGVEQNAGQRPEGRGQLDYVLRLATALKQEEAKNGEEFRAIGVLGSDVYDKLLILQALRPTFPRAIFFTTDLNARLASPAQWLSTRNLIIASHYSLELESSLQTPIPPFRDSYQTSLFYSALWALEHFVPSQKAECPGCFQLRAEMGKAEPRLFSPHARPRLYEIGRHGGFDISADPLPHSQSTGHAVSIHPPRSDLNLLGSFAPTQNWLAQTGWAVLTVLVLIAGAMLISSAVTNAVLRLASSKLFWLAVTMAAATGYAIIEWIMWRVPNAAENEPFTWTEGISAWPSAIIRLIALVMSLAFLWYSWWKLQKNEHTLTQCFMFEEKNEPAGNPTGNKTLEESNRGPSGTWRIFSSALSSRLHRCIGLHAWRPQTAEQISAGHLWHEYVTLGRWKNFLSRVLPQLAVAWLAALLLMKLLGFPQTPCRGAACVEINNAVVILAVISLMVLIFYVVDTTRLCQRWVICIGMKKIRWPAGTLDKLSAERNMSKQTLEEWLSIELIAERTTVIGNFIYFPFIVMSLLGMARHRYFDNWDFPTTLIIIFTLSAALVIISSMALRHSAEIAKREAIKRLESRLIDSSRVPKAPEGEQNRQELEAAIQAIKNNHRGAFLPFTQHPVFGAAVALPSGAYGVVLLAEYLATGFGG
jgi:hypothetical protein